MMSKDVEQDGAYGGDVHLDPENKVCSHVCVWGGGGRGGGGGEGGGGGGGGGGGVYATSLGWCLLTFHNNL